MVSAGSLYIDPATASVQLAIHCCHCNSISQHRTPSPSQRFSKLVPGTKMRTVQLMLIMALALVALSSGASALSGPSGCGWSPYPDAGIPNGKCIGTPMSDKCSRACRSKFLTGSTGYCRDGARCECYYCTDAVSPAPQPMELN
ncbi:hypothetical protein BS78_04G060300 [Paspalum vaginatum]|nr:hypothetical protein BS78_04G060300 [Paspalum vaginatum]